MQGYPAVRQVATPTITAALSAAGKSLGGVLTLSSVVRSPAWSGQILTVTISDKAKQNAAIDVVFFTAQPASAIVDNTTFAPSAADLLNVVGVVSIAAGDYASFSANSVATKQSVNFGFQVAGGRDLFAALVCRGTPTYASTSDLQLGVHVLQD